MSRSHPIYCTISGQAKASSADFGSRDGFTQVINVGTSASNSHKLGTVATRRIEIQGTDWIAFTLSIDGEQVRRALFNTKTKQYAPVALNVPIDTAIATLEG